MEYKQIRNPIYFLLTLVLIILIMVELFVVHNLYEIINNVTIEFPIFELTLIISLISIFYYFLLKIWEFGVIGYFFHSKVDYCIAYTPLLFLNFSIFFSNIIKYYGVDGILVVLGYTIVFVILIYKSRALEFLTEMFRLLGVTIYCTIGHYNIELFMLKLPYVIMIMFCINIILPICWVSFWSKMLQYRFSYYINKKLLQYILLVSKLKRSKIYIKLPVYYLLITTPILLTQYLEIPMVGVTLVLLIITYNKLAIEYYCLITRNPWMLLKSVQHETLSFTEMAGFLNLYGTLISELEYYGENFTHVWQIKLMLSSLLYIDKICRGGKKQEEEKEFADDLVLILKDHPDIEFSKFQTKMQGLITNSPSIYSFVVSGLVLYIL